MPFDYTSGNPDNLVGGGPARMQDIQGPFFDIRAYLNSAIGGGGSSLPVLAGVPVLDVGVANQRRAGRQLTNADFTALGLSVPIALWNLSDLTDVSGNARVLTNKGGVGFGTGINGIANTSAIFSGSTGQALYIADSGAADPFRIRTGSWGCWCRTAKRGTDQMMMSKMAASGTYAWRVFTHNSNIVAASVSPEGTTVTQFTGVSDVADDRWHFVVVTADGTALRIYVDGVLEGSGAAGPIFPGGSPLNIGGAGADNVNNATTPFCGRVDEAFVTADVLSDDQVRLLYAAKLTHTLGAQPSGVSLSVHRKRKGGALVAGDFTTQPLRLHNFTLADGASGAGDAGSNGITLAPGTGTSPVNVAGADGGPNGGFSFIAANAGLTATDAGLPAGTTSRSYGCWFKSSVSNSRLIGWGTINVADAMLGIGSTGNIFATSGADVVGGAGAPYVIDGLWHHAVVVEDNAAVDGVKRKLYLDGRLVAGSTVMTALALAGANRFRIGAAPDASLPFTGQIDGAFVCGYAMTLEDVLKLYAKGSQDLGASPKNAGDHIERVDATAVYLIADSLESQHTLDLGVMA